MALRSGVVVALLLLVAPVGANSPQDFVDQGNAAYGREDYDKALSSYDEASVAAPESPHIAFNKGAVYYRQGEYTKARESFEEAALKSTETHLAARCKFNLGNTAFREFERQQDSDLEKALEACRESVGHYQEALRLDPELKVAAENIEVVRLVMKSILDKIKEQKEAAEKQKQAQQEIAEKLEELIDRQESAAARSRESTDSASDQALGQRQLQGETEQLASDLADTSKTPFPADQVREHVEGAVGNQDAAASALERDDAGAAAPDQDEAAEDLKKALAALSQGQEEGGEQEQQPDNSGQQESDPSQSPNESAAADSSQAPQQQEQTAPMSEEARDILDEERENAERRTAQAPGYRAVDRDW